MRPTPRTSTAAFCFTQDGGKVSSDQSETLFDVTPYRQLGSCFRHSIMPGENPKCSRAIIDFKGAPSQDTIRIDHFSGHRDLFARVTSGISIDLLDTHARRAPSQQQDGQSQRQYRNNPGVLGYHDSSKQVVERHKPQDSTRVAVLGDRWGASRRMTIRRGYRRPTDLSHPKVSL